MVGDTDNGPETDNSSGASAAEDFPTKTPLYVYAQCIAATEGKGIPDDISSTIARYAVIRGLRCPYNFTISPAVIELGLDGKCRIPEFARSRNARLVMSNVIPDGLEYLEVQPYCIWHPGFADEEAYRQLVYRYPTMRYHELDLLPEVSIAEEPREGETEGGREIYEMIMSAPLEYAVVDDWTRTANADTPRVSGFLNGDTAPRWSLQRRYPPSKTPEVIAAAI
ncbi:hypothetical protein N7457_002313 [Penicillium paradoxum]|uniref:uncharacterized protein n=1 Tax=Penicillium paradoxum TaxID=176176 RepID=UPI00254886C9|nr:uncharacterized protein N7457_002313 [Penicillium paradoxum]KAJ5787323.1 hypothetical protein N7457_002313 [Penicillium paradoxum]